MFDSERHSMQETDLDERLKRDIPDPPPEEIIHQVTPWRKAMRQVLIGSAFASITLHAYCLDYILPAVGMILSILGFRTLRKENKWFRTCFLLTAVQAVYLFAHLILNTTILQEANNTSLEWWVLIMGKAALEFSTLYCLWRGLRAVQKKAGLPPRAGSAVALLAWNVVVYVIGVLCPDVMILSGVMIVAYILIIRSLYKLSKELDHAGYSIETAPVKVTDRAAAIGLTAVLLIGCVCGYAFGGSYRMDWTPLPEAEHQRSTGIETHLLDLGFPKDVLDDLQSEEVLACKDALQVISQTYDAKAGYGVIDTLSKDSPDPNASSTAASLRITTVAVQLPGERAEWRMIHHFQWLDKPRFYGTEAIRVRTSYNMENWDYIGPASGRLLYTKNGTSYTALYHFLGDQSYTSSDMVFGETTSTDLFAAFSLPNDGENQRGYIAYTVRSKPIASILNTLIDYNHQKSLLQYPAVTAMENCQTDVWSRAYAFELINDQFLLHPDDVYPPTADKADSKETA